MLFISIQNLCTPYLCIYSRYISVSYKYRYMCGALSGSSKLLPQLHTISTRLYNAIIYKKIRNSKHFPFSDARCCFALAIPLTNQATLLHIHSFRTRSYGYVLYILTSCILQYKSIKHIIPPHHIASHSSKILLVSLDWTIVS